MEKIPITSIVFVEISERLVDGWRQLILLGHYFRRKTGLDASVVLLGDNQLLVE